MAQYIFINNPLSQAQWETGNKNSVCPTCKAKFGFRVKKRNCQACGKLFCTKCAPKVGMIAAQRDFVGVCGPCFTVNKIEGTDTPQVKPNHGAAGSNPSANRSESENPQTCAVAFCVNERVTQCYCRDHIVNTSPYINSTNPTNPVAEEETDAAVDDEEDAKNAPAEPIQPAQLKQKCARHADRVRQLESEILAAETKWYTEGKVGKKTESSQMR